MEALTDTIIDYFAEDESFWQDVRQSEKWMKF